MLYHVTEYHHLHAILRDGLLPKIGERAALTGKTIPAIYLFPSLRECDKALGGWFANHFESIPIGHLVILVISPEGLSLSETTSYEITSVEPITPSSIVRVLREDLQPLSNLRE